MLLAHDHGHDCGRDSIMCLRPSVQPQISLVPPSPASSMASSTRAAGGSAPQTKASTVLQVSLSDPSRTSTRDVFQIGAIVLLAEHLSIAAPRPPCEAGPPPAQPLQTTKATPMWRSSFFSRSMAYTVFWSAFAASFMRVPYFAFTHGEWGTPPEFLFTTRHPKKATLPPTNQPPPALGHVVACFVLYTAFLVMPLVPPFVYSILVPVLQLCHLCS